VASTRQVGMLELVELMRRLETLWIPGAMIAALLLLLILWEIGLVLGVLLSVAGKERSRETTPTAR
jgi:hypothetical protein